jgi:DNA/RNA-binding domain of Phe-tRNA-synthetase-like protein
MSKLINILRYERTFELMNLKIHYEIKTRFPKLNVLTLNIQGLKIKKRDCELENFKLKVIKEIRNEYNIDSVKDETTFRAYRDFFWSIRIDPTKTRPASEALIRRILAGKKFPTINTLVDAYNLASIKSKIALATFDADKLEGEILMRFSKEGEKIWGIGMKKPFILKEGKIVISDTKKLIAVYPYRDSDNTKVTEKTEKVTIIICGVPGITKEVLKSASNMTFKYISRFCKEK